MTKQLFRDTGILLLVTILLLFGISAYQGATELTVVSYTLEAPLTASIRIVHLTDLHSHVFGSGNDVLAAQIAQQEPDLILMSGDMMDRSDDNPDVICHLIRQLVEIAPVYYGHGNHEMDWMLRTGTDLTPILSLAGATVLDCTYQDVTVNGQALRIGGYHNYYRHPGMRRVTAQEAERELAFVEDFEHTDRYKILLSHIATAWLDWGYRDRYPVDLVLTGHFHGGQIRLPLLGGLYAPYVGFFPEYTEGMFPGEQATCILSTGLGSSPGIPRINNLPQIVVVDLIPE